MISASFPNSYRIELVPFILENPERPLDFRFAATREEVDSATIWSVIVIDETLELESLDCEAWDIEFTGEGAAERSSAYADALSQITAWPIFND